MARTMSCSITLLLLLFTLASTLEVSPNSPCALKCIDDPKNGNVSDKDDSLTFHQNLACLDEEFVGNNATDVGKKFADCQSCEQKSGYSEETYGERDSAWYMFNNKGTVDWCLFGRFAEENNPNVSSTYPYQQCFTSCQAIRDSSDFKIKSDIFSYIFCDYNGNYTQDAEACVTCLYNTTGLTILGNILTSVQELCIQKPGKDFNFDADVYNTNKIELASATTTESSSTSPSATSHSSAPAASGSSGLGAGAIGGIVLGALVGLALILVGMLLILRRRKNQRKSVAMPKETHLDSMSNTAPPEVGGSGHYVYEAMNESPTVKHAYQPGSMREAEVVPAELGAVDTAARHQATELPTSPQRRQYRPYGELEA